MKRRSHTAVVVVGSLGLAGLQYVVARQGSLAADRAEGFDGIGVAFGYLAGEASMTLVAVLIAARALGIKHWISAAAAVAVGDAALLTLFVGYLDSDDQGRWPGAAAYAAALLVPALVIVRVAQRRTAR